MNVLLAVLILIFSLYIIAAIRIAMALTDENFKTRILYGFSWPLLMLVTLGFGIVEIVVYLGEKFGWSGRR